MWIIILVITTAVFAIGWLKWKISTLALIYYLEKNQYKQPDDSELRECTGFVAKNMIMDLTGRKDNR